MYTTFDEMVNLEKLAASFGIKHYRTFLVSKVNQIFGSVNMAKQSIEHCQPGVCMPLQGEAEGFVLIGGKGSATYQVHSESSKWAEPYALENLTHRLSYLDFEEVGSGWAPACLVFAEKQAKFLQRIDAVGQVHPSFSLNTHSIYFI